MKRILIILSVIAAIIALILFNRMTSKKDTSNIYADVKIGLFEITVSNSGELLAEKSIDVKGPEIGRGQQPGRGPGQGPQGRGGDMHAMELKIQDIVPEGTIVNEGEYIAQLDRTSYSNTLKDALENFTKLQTTVEMKILDTAVTLTNLRDEIKNQKIVVEEASIVLAQSKYEPPATIRKAEIELDKAKRTLEQKIKGYALTEAKTIADINHEKMHLAQGTRLVNDLEEFLTKFTITAPASGMVIYKKERNGNKRKTGSMVNPFDRVIATLPDLSAMISKVYVNEIEISKVKPGQKVLINVDAFPEKTYNGNVISIANVGEQLPNSDAKMFEVQIKVNESDPTLRPSMTTTNKIIIKTFNDVLFIPTECVQTGTDSIPFVYEKNRTKQIVVLGENNEKNVIVEKGLEPGTLIYITPPADAEEFRLKGEDLISIVNKQR